MTPTFGSTEHTMSFVRKAKSKTAASELKLLSGTILSSNQQCVTSSGIQSLDAVFGGGLQLSSSVMLVEDHISAFHTVLTNCFISEGIGQKHAVLNISGHSHSEFEQFLKSLPHNSTLSGPVPRVPSTYDMEMVADFADTDADRNTTPSLSIAWQYQKYIDSPSADPSSNLRSSRNVNLSYSGFREDKPKARVGFSNYCHSFDFSGTIDPLLLEPATLGHIEVPTDHWNRDIPFSEAVSTNIAVDVLQQVDYFLSNVRSGLDPSVSRIVLHSLPPESFHEDLKQSFSKWINLLSGLRALARKFSAVLWVSIPEWVVSSNLEFARCVHLFDCVLQITSFSGNGEQVSSEKSQFGDHDGIIEFRRQSQINFISTLGAHVPISKSLFKIKRRKVEIVPFTLPPDETDKNPNSIGSCSAQKGLDF